MVTPPARSKVDRPGLELAVAFVVCFAAQAIGAAMAHANMGWHDTLAKPSFTPPNIVFPIAWTALYALMAISVWLFWRSPDGAEDKKLGLVWFGIQLVLNGAWVFVYFVLHSLMGGMIVILALLVAIAITIVLFDRLSRQASLLLMPYLLWVAFATALNLGVWILNPAA